MKLGIATMCLAVAAMLSFPAILDPGTIIAWWAALATFATGAAHCAVVWMDGDDL